MPVFSGAEAHAALRTLFARRVPVAEVVRDRPEGLTVSAGGARDEAMELGGYTDPRSYAIPRDEADSWCADDADHVSALVLSPTEMLEQRPEAAATYRRRSVDLTMRGGTTSGIVYPLAVAEIAKAFHVRNVGGASAGAIAAAATAAAEIGRGATPPHMADAQLPAEAVAQGHVRPGFVGLADTVWWLTQQDEPTAPDRFRLSQLFRAAEARRRVYAVLVAAMRGRVWAVPLTMLLAFDLWTRLLILAACVGFVGVATVAPAPAAEWLQWLQATGVVVAWFAVIAALLQLGKAGSDRARVLRRRGRARGGQGISGWTSAAPSPHREWIGIAVTLGVLGAAAVFLILAGTPSLYGLVVTLALSFVLAVVVLGRLWVFLADGGRMSYGLVPGASPWRRRQPSEVLAGVPTPRVERALLPWLDGSLGELAGLAPSTVLTFAHLWDGPALHGDRDRLLAQARDPRRRRVNLELITSDLSRQRPYRFPLPPTEDVEDSEAIWFAASDLRDVLPDRVVAHLVAHSAETRTIDDEDGRRLELHRLPEPWDLPVVFAVRLSLSLPGLFTAVRLHRITAPAELRDDLGRTLERDGAVPMVPPEPVAQPLWFSDGGITSNFPVHLFDQPLPEWPTFGLNLGSHPTGFEHQDVWLPEDWQSTASPREALGPGALSFGGAILDTARSWRDTMQTGMPSYRGRVAWVRQRKDEGGNNLFMRREVIASMALRGAVAGARLRERFSDGRHPDRYRWLRLRVALANLHDLGRSVRLGAAAYDDVLCGGAQWLTRRQAGWDDGPGGGRPPNWYEPDAPDFWARTSAVVRGASGLDCGNGAGMNTPTPLPDLRQTPRQ